MDIVKQLYGIIKPKHITLLQNTKLKVNYRGDCYNDSENLTLLSKLVLLANKSYLRSNAMLDIIKEYIETYPDELNKNSYCSSPLLVAVHKGNLEVIKLLLDYGANIKMIRMWELACLNNILVIKLLAERKLFNINEKGYDGDTILMLRLCNSNMPRLEAVKLFLELGADPNIQNINRKSALTYAIKHLERDGIKIIELLLKYDACNLTSLNLLKSKKQTALKNKALKLVEGVVLLNIKN